MEKIIPYNEELEALFNKAKRYLHASMNGITSEGMASLGYQLNYGVALSRIKEIAMDYPSDRFLAQRCWWSNCRELMIMGTFIYPIDQLTLEEATEWGKKCFNLELCEQISFNLFRKSPLANDILQSFLSSEEEYLLAIAFILGAHLCKLNKISRESIEEGILAARKLFHNESRLIKSTLSKFLSSLVRIDRSSAEEILKELDAAGDPWAQSIAEEIRTELLF